jgi:uncharacterized protein (TIGR03437 family)
MKTRSLIVLAVAAVTALADINGTSNITTGTSFSLDSGTAVTSGADLLFTGASINASGTATFIDVGPGGAATYGVLTASTLMFITGTSTTSISGPSLVTNELFVVHTNGGNSAAVLITAVSTSSLTIQFKTFGNTTGSGGGNVPTIAAVENNYGAIQPGLPNYGIAPGSLFVVAGSGLAASPATSLQSSAAPGLQTTLNGVTVTVTVGGASVACPLYYLSPTQIDAVLPGNTPAGTGTITVSYNGTMSAPAPIVVAQSAFGILTYNGTLAAAYDGGNNLITGANAANPGQTIVIYGSGVGADPGNNDKVFPQNLNNLTNIPLQAYVGGVQATVLYRGRSQFPGVDQINLTLPSSGIPTGCFVSLMIVSGTIPFTSNGATIPVAASGKTCSDPNSIFTPNLTQTLSGKTTVHFGILTASQTTQIGGGGSTPLINSLGGIFESVSGTQYATGTGGNSISIGSCIVKSPTFTGYNSVATALDAGPTINVSGPQGSIGLTQIAIPNQTLRIYAASSVPANFIPASGGPFTFDNGSGGADVGHFNTTTNFPMNFAWTNSGSVTVVNRSQGVTVTWSGGAPGAYVTISGSSTSSPVNGAAAVTAGFTCQAPLSAGTFTVPAPVLLALPPSTQGRLSLADSTTPQAFTATGLDLGYSASMAEFDENVQYN